MIKIKTEKGFKPFSKQWALLSFFVVSFFFGSAFWSLAYIFEGVKFCIPWVTCIHPLWHIFRILSVVSPLFALLLAFLNYDDDYEVPTIKKHTLGEYQPNIIIIDNKGGEQFGSNKHG